jgi:hypothetical protein
MHILFKIDATRDLWLQDKGGRWMAGIIGDPCVWGGWVRSTPRGAIRAALRNASACAGERIGRGVA